MKRFIQLPSANFHPHGGRLLTLFAATFLAIQPLRALPAESAFRDFIRVRGDQLIEDGKPFRFISFNIPNLHLIEDNVGFAQANPWRLPDRFEIADALKSVRQQGGTVVRTYVISVARPDDAPGTPRHVLGIGRFNETAFRALDEVLQVANQTGVRVIIPLVDNWSWMGGRAEYAGFRGKAKDDFWTDPQIIADFEQTIRFVLTRTNTLTGVAYRDDKAVLCWETGNEVQSPPAWTRTIAACIKSLDTNHLVMDGFYAGQLRDESLAMPEVDIVTTHHYPNTGSKPFAELVRANWAKAKGKKPYVVGEFGFVRTAEIAAMLDAVVETGTAGALAWSLRFRDRDGGFYWHTEGGSGSNAFKAFHWPGFATGANYDEQNLMALMQRRAFEIRGLRVPKISVPAPPTLLPTADAGAISWQGSVGATSYVVERAVHRLGPWRVAGLPVDETAVQYRPLFADTNVSRGNWFYRVRARNDSGISEPSNVVGPVAVRQGVMVDELADFSLLHEHRGSLELKTDDCRKAREDAHRVAGRAGDALVYRLAGPVRSCRLYAFFPGDIADFCFSVSEQGRDYVPVTAARTVYADAGGDYGYWKPVCYELKLPAARGKFLKIEFAGGSQIGRVELRFDD